MERCTATTFTVRRTPSPTPHSIALARFSTRTDPRAPFLPHPDLDYWHAQEDLKDSRLPPHPPKSKLSRPRLVRAQSSARRSREVSDTPSGGEPEAETDDEEDDFFNDLEWTVDAQNFGNVSRVTPTPPVRDLGTDVLDSTLPTL